MWEIMILKKYMVNLSDSMTHSISRLFILP